VPRARGVWFSSGSTFSTVACCVASSTRKRTRAEKGIFVDVFEANCVASGWVSEYGRRNFKVSSQPRGDSHASRSLVFAA